MSKDEAVNGAKIAADILSRMDSSTQERLVKNIEQAAPELAIKIHENLFSFDDIAALPDRGIQILAQSVNHHDLVLSLKKAQPTTKEKVYQNVSERKRNLLQDDEGTLSSVKSSEVDAAQKRVLSTLDELRATGKIRAESEQDIWVA